MADVPRIEPKAVRRAQRDPDRQIYLVCAYDDHAKCEDLRLESAMTLHELEQQEDQIPRDAELVFYCT